MTISYPGEVVAIAYEQSIPLQQWLGERRQRIDTLARAHAAIGAVDGRKRPLEVGRPVGQAYVLILVSEFQAFVRDIHDLAVQRLVQLSGAQLKFQPQLIAAASDSRQIDRANANIRTMNLDFRRLGLHSLESDMSSRNTHWNPQRHRGDRAYYGDLLELRNALAHGNQRQLERLRQRGVMDTVTWARKRLPGMNRIAMGLDRAVWDHVLREVGVEPW